MGAALRRHWPLWCALASVVIGRVVIAHWPISPDESGFYLVADDLLHHGGESLYGHYWVDRPPTLIWIFMLAAACGTVEAIRWLVALAFLGFVTLSYAAARLLGGARTVAVFLAAALSVSPAVGASVGNGEAFAIPFVMGSVVAILLAERYDGTRALLWAAAAGLLGLTAMSVKQNFAEGLIFCLVLLVLAGVRGEQPWPDVVRRLGAGLAGVVVGCGVLLAWAVTTGAGAGALWEASVSFRLQATGVLRAGPRDAIDERLSALLSDAWASGAIPLLLVLLVVVLGSRLRGSTTAWAAGCVIVVEVFGIVVGGQFWSHYLLGLAPGLVLAVALAARPRPGRRPHSRPDWRRWLVLPAVGYVVLASAWLVPWKAHEAAGWGTSSQAHVGGFVADSVEPGDTATVLFGRADYQRETGLRSPYRHLWSLPIRVLDPDLDELTELLSGPDAPVWLVQIFPLDSWGLDPASQLPRVIEQRYERVLDDCGAYVYLLRNQQRVLAPAPDC